MELSLPAPQVTSSSDPTQSSLAADGQQRDKSKERGDKDRRHREKRKDKEARGSEPAGQGQVDPGGGGEESAGQEEEVRRDSLELYMGQLYDGALCNMYEVEKMHRRGIYILKCT